MLVDLSKCRAQTLAHRAFQPGKTVCLPWGRGIGKSFFARLLWYLLVSAYDGQPRIGTTITGVRMVLLMPTLKQAKKVHAQLAQREMGPRGPWHHLGVQINKTDWRFEFPGGSWLQWVSAENIQEQRGIRCDAVFVDECDDIAPDLISAVCDPWLSEPFSLRYRLFGGTPRRGRYGLLYRAFREWPRQSPDTCFAFHATAYDAPELVDPVYVEDVRSRTSSEIFRREWLCDFDSAEGLVYPHFSEGFHVREPPPGARFREYIVGMDFGYEDPAAILVMGVAGSGLDTTIHLIDEVYVRHRTDTDLADIARRLEMLYPRAKWYADPSRPQTIESLRREARIKIQGADNAIEDGVATVADALAVRKREDGGQWAQFYISPRAPNTIREFGMYRRKRDPKNSERILDDIEDRDNHAMDAARYALFSHFGRPDNRIMSGYEVG